MKVAVLFTGQIRDGINYTNQNYNFFIKDVNPDIYIHSYECDGINSIVDFYKPKYAFFEKLENIKLDENLIKKCEQNKVFYETVTTNVLYMWRKRKEGFKLIPPNVYDKILFTRFDCYGDKSILEYLNNSELMIPEKRDYHNGINDLCCLGSYEQVKYYTDLYDYVEDYLSEKCIFHPETFLRYHLNKNKNIDIKRIDVKLYLRNFYESSI
jgi:hypothetical protein